MRKQWIKPESLYHKPFYKKKFQMTLLGVFLMAVIFFAYQLFYIRQLQIEVEHKAFVAPVLSSVKSTPEKETKRILRWVFLNCESYGIGILCDLFQSCFSNFVCFSSSFFDTVVYAWKIMICTIQCCGTFSFACNLANQYNGKDWTMTTVIVKRMEVMNRKRMHVQMVFSIVQRHIINGLFIQRCLPALPFLIVWIFIEFFVIFFSFITSHTRTTGI